MTDVDTIEITGISGWGHHGVFDEERAQGQEFLVDVTLGLDISAATASDDLAATVDYGHIAQRVHEVLVGEPTALIETLAQRMVDVCRDAPGFAAVTFMEVAVHKPSAPISVPFSDVIVRIRREFR